jgi:Domain of unknown function (DUF222)
VSDTSAVDNRFARMRAAEGTFADAPRHVVEVALQDCGHLASWVESVRLSALTRLQVLAEADTSIDPETVAAVVGRTSRRNASAAARRAKVTSQMPTLGEGLSTGAITADHVDAVAQALARLEPDERARLADEADWIKQAASRSTPEQLTKLLQQRARQLSADDGIARLERQRRNIYLRWWLDKNSGMLNFHGEFDPESGAIFTGRVRRMVEALFHDKVPDTCPTDERKQDHLRALALLKLTEGETTGASSTRADLVVVIDFETLLNGVHANSRIDVESGVELPIETIRRMACLANIIPAVMGADGVVLDLGRSQRVANAHQRRALQVMYATCAVHGCDVAAHDCQPHHIAYWGKHHGPTDIANLIPLCSRHHHFVHEGGWMLSLNPTTRYLTVTLPDGTRMTHHTNFARAG